MDKEKRGGYYAYKFMPGEEKLQERAETEGVPITPLGGGGMGSWISIERFPKDWQKLEGLAKEMGFPVNDITPKPKT